MPSAAEEHFTAGVAFRAEGRDADAEAAFREAVRLDPDSSQWPANLKKLLREAERHNKRRKRPS